MDFEVGTWKTSKKADALNEKLFGQDSTKSKKSVTGSPGSEDTSKKKKKKKKDDAIAEKKPKTKEEAMALAYARKNKKRKMKQQQQKYQAKLQRGPESTPTPKKAKKKKKKKTNTESATEIATPNERKPESSLSKDAPKTKIASKKNPNSKKTYAEPMERNKYKHLAKPAKPEVQLTEAKHMKLASPVVTKKFNGNEVKGKHFQFGDDSDEENGNEANETKKINTNRLTLDSGKQVSKSKNKEIFQDSSSDGGQSEDEVSPSKKKCKRTLDDSYSSAEPKKKKHKNKTQELDSIDTSPTIKSSKKDKFDSRKLKSVLQKSPSATTRQQDISEDDDEEDDDEEDNDDADNSPQSLKHKMVGQLNSARFRFINEQLYTSTSEEAVEMMKEDPEAFNVYHQGFQSQVNKWPSNPLNVMVSYLKKRPKSLVVADLGCGDAQLAESVRQKVYSFDLVSTKKSVIACDIADVPLEDGSVDVCVFCLSLMGTNLADFITEANRITKMKGTLLIAEVLSRFEKLSKFIKKLEKMGFTLRNKDESNKMFVWLELEKTGEPDLDRIPKLELAPCIYKKR